MRNVEDTTPLEGYENEPNPRNVGCPMSANINFVGHGYKLNVGVQLNPMPFYEILDDLMNPSKLYTSSEDGPSRVHENTFTFKLSPDQVTQLSQDRNLHVQLRICGTNENTNTLSSLYIRLNGKFCQFLNPYQSKNSEVGPKFPIAMINITPLCHMDSTENVIDVSWKSVGSPDYFTSVYLTQQLTSGILLSRIRDNRVQEPNRTLDAIKEKFRQFPDSDIETTSVKIPLVCLISKKKIRLPCRASTCTHLQCFDAQVFLEMNEKKPMWICPICRGPANYRYLIIDGLLLNIVNKVPPQCTDVEFGQDGTWVPMKNDPKRRKTEIEVVDLTIE